MFLAITSVRSTVWQKNKWSLCRAALVALLIFSCCTPCLAAGGDTLYITEQLNIPETGERYHSFALGNFISDAVRFASGSDVALIPTGMLHEKLYLGKISGVHLGECVDTDETMVTVELTSDQLKELLDWGTQGVIVDSRTECIDTENSNFDFLFQVSGLNYRYDPVALSQRRIYQMKPEFEGKITVALPQSVLAFVPNEVWNGTKSETGMTIGDALAVYLESDFRYTENISEERFVSVGTRDTSLISGYPKILIVAAAVFLALLWLIFIPNRFGRMMQAHGLSGQMKDDRRD